MSTDDTTPNSSESSANQPSSNAPKKKLWKRARTSSPTAPSALFAQPLDNPDLPAQSRLKTEGRTSERATKRRFSGVLTRNRRLAYVIAFTQSVGFLTPIWVIFGTDHLELSLTLSLILGSTNWVASAFFEVPMGAFADKYGRQLSLVLGLGLTAVGDFALIVWDDFYLLMAFQIIAGLGFAMISGSLEGLLHDTYAAHNEPTGYAKLSSQLLFLLNVSRILTVPLGAWLYQMNVDGELSSYTYPYIANVICMCIAMTCAGFLVEERSEERKPNDEQGRFAQAFIGQVTETYKEMRSNSVVTKVAVVFGLYAFIGEGNWSLYQSYFRDRDIEVSDSGWIYTGLVVLMALGSRFVPIVYRRVNVLWAMIGIVALVSIGTALMHLPMYIAIFAFILNAFVAPMCFYLHDNAIQNRMSGNHKSTSLSIASMSYTLGSMFGVFAVGAVADSLGVSTAQWIFVVYGAAVVAAMSLWCMREKLEPLPEDKLASSGVEGDEYEVTTPFDDVGQINN